MVFSFVLLVSSDFELHVLNLLLLLQYYCTMYYTSTGTVVLLLVLLSPAVRRRSIRRSILCVVISPLLFLAHISKWPSIRWTVKMTVHLMDDTAFLPSIRWTVRERTVPVQQSGRAAGKNGQPANASLLLERKTPILYICSICNMIFLDHSDFTMLARSGRDRLTTAKQGLGG